MADARDLKSRGSNPVPVRPRSPAPYRGVEQLVARRAHNPEVVGSSPASATIKNPVIATVTGFFLFVCKYFINRIFFVWCLFGVYCSKSKGSAIELKMKRLCVFLLGCGTHSLFLSYFTLVILNRGKNIF